MMKQSALGGSSDLNDVVEAATLKAVFVKLLKGGHEDLTAGGFRGFDGGRGCHNDCDDTDQSVCCQEAFKYFFWGAGKADFIAERGENRVIHDNHDRCLARSVEPGKQTYPLAKL